MVIIKKEYTTFDADLKKMNKRIYIGSLAIVILLVVEPILSFFE